MPLVRISLVEGKPEPHRRAIGDAVHQAMVDTIDVLPHDRFQIITEHAETAFIFRGGRQHAESSSESVIVQITLNAGRSLDKKKALYQRMTELLARYANIRDKDVFISLVEVEHDNWFVL